MINWIFEIMPLFLVKILAKKYFEKYPLGQFIVVNPRCDVFIRVGDLNPEKKRSIKKGRIENMDETFKDFKIEDSTGKFKLINNSELKYVGEDPINCEIKLIWFLSGLKSQRGRLK